MGQVLLVMVRATQRSGKWQHLPAEALLAPAGKSIGLDGRFLSTGICIGSPLYRLPNGLPSCLFLTLPWRQ